jgi:hypothetical protein
MSLSEKKRNEDREARKRLRKNDEIEAKILINRCRSDGVYDPSQIIMTMLTKGGKYSAETKALLDDLNEENIAELQASGFKEHEIHVLK